MRSVAFCFGFSFYFGDVLFQCVSYNEFYVRVSAGFLSVQPQLMLNVKQNVVAEFNILHNCICLEARLGHILIELHEIRLIL